MNQHLIVKKNVPVDASPSAVWQVLTQPVFIRQWDELPDDYDDHNFLETGSQILWNQPNGQITKLTVMRCKANEVLKLNLYNSSWPLPESAYDIYYLYTLEAKVNDTVLKIEIGDFSVLSEGENYYSASLEFSEAAALKIKSLAQSSAVVIQSKRII